MTLEDLVRAIEPRHDQVSRRADSTGDPWDAGYYTALDEILKVISGDDLKYTTWIYLCPDEAKASEPSEGR